MAYVVHPRGVVWCSAEWFRFVVARKGLANMGKLKSLKPVVGKLVVRQLGNALQPIEGIKRTLTGRRLQATRFRLWQANPYCKGCGRLLAYPDGFELDHVTPISVGGSDEDTNLELLCTDEVNPANGCHAKKTRQEDKDRIGDRS